ncbi:MAG TPA: LEA type 2 family protein, partial [Burkholderiales bacterium]|nr:LEA type 2 family protein [Burkholderiales bacterium]
MASRKHARILLLLLVLAGCVTAPPPDVFVINLEPLEGGGLEQRVKVDLRVQNPSTQPISAAGMSLRLIVNGQPLARGVSNERFTVPPLGEATTSIVTSTTLIDLLRQVHGAQSRTSLDYRLEGKLYLDSPPGRSLSFETEGRLEPPGAAGA